MYENLTCGECGGEVEDFMHEAYEMFIDPEEGVEEFLCGSCLDEASGEL